LAVVEIGHDRIAGPEIDADVGHGDYLKKTTKTQSEVSIK
jgi:hypothetical protein